jgi:hypothetical protein
MLHYAHYSTHLVFLFVICFWAFDLGGLVGVLARSSHIKVWFYIVLV